MGLLNRKKRDYTDKFASNISPAAKHAWMKQASQQNLLSQWGEALLRIEELFMNPILYYPEKQPEVLRELHNLKTEWLKIDRELLEENEAETLYDVLHQEVPALIYRFNILKSTRNALNQNHEDDYLSLQKKLEQVFSEVSRVRALADTQKLARFKNLHPGAPNKHLTKLDWPTFPELPANIQASLIELRTLWENQKGKVQTVEDEYLLERIVTDYIPSSVSLYQPFISDNAELEAAAREALLSQLQLILGHLQGMSKRSFGEQMKSINAQTQFLKDRLDL